MTTGTELQVEPAGGSRPGAEQGTRAALVRLCVVLAAGVAVAVLLHALAALVVVLAIVAMIMLHELGHFATAKWSGMKVTEYFLGFGPRVWSVRRGETEYGVKAIPAGGYVKIVGMSSLEQVDPADEARTYRAQSFARRVLVAMAGSTMHYVLALLLLWSAIAIAGVPSATKVSVSSLTPFATSASPAQKAGLRPGDVFVSIDGKPVANAQALVRTVQASAGRELTVVVQRQGRDVTLRVTPVSASSVRLKGGAVPEPPGKSSVGIIGVALGAPTVRANPAVALVRASEEVGSLSAATVRGLGQIFSPHGIESYVSQVTGGSATATSASGAAAEASAPRLTSIYGAARLATQAAAAGTSDLLYVLAALNVFIGIFNMVPLLPLDGGHVAVALYERLRSRRTKRYRADVAKLLPATYLVIVLLVALGASALYLDITHPLANPFQ